MTSARSVHDLVRRTHEERVLDALRRHGPVTRAELTGLVGLSRTTLSEITADLLRRAAVVVVDTDAAGRVGSGRPAERLALDPSSGQFLGMDFGHRQVHIAVADAAREVIATGAAGYAEGAGWPQRIEQALAVVDRMVREQGVRTGALQAVGVGVPGPYRPRGVAGSAATDAVAGALGARFRCPVVVDNNVRFAALAEAQQTGEETRELLYVRLGDGVGGGLVVDGRLVTGAEGLAGEFGHVRVAHGDLRCRCGRTGCLETVASVPAVLAACRARGLAVDDLDDLAELAVAGHPVVEAVLDDAGSALGRLLASVAMVLDPAEIVVAGEITARAPGLLAGVARVVADELAGHGDALPVVRPTRLPPNAGALGALTAVVRQSVQLARPATDPPTDPHPKEHRVTPPPPPQHGGDAA